MVTANQKTRPEANQVLGTAVLRASERMGLSRAELAKVLGRDRSSISRSGVDPESKAGELAKILIRCYRALAVMVDDNPQQIRELGTNWRSKIDVGFNWQNGSKDKQDVSLRFESRRKIGKSDYRFQTRYLLAKTNGTTSADSLDAGLRWRRDFNDRWFTQTNTTYYDDGVREIDLNVDQNAGFGYRILTGDLAKANLGAGVTVQYRQAAGVDEGVAKFGEFFQDLVWRFHDRFEFSQEASARFSPDERPLGLPSSGTQVASGVPNYRLVFESVVRGQITETMTVNLRYEFKFDNAIANRDARADQRITTGLGYAF
jgi:putative salt-induced outer membrane protein YdiY